MKGIRNGYRLKSSEEPREEDEGMNHENGIMMLNFDPDFWELKEQFDLLNSTQDEEKINPSKPSCTVIIKVICVRLAIVVSLLSS